MKFKSRHNLSACMVFTLLFAWSATCSAYTLDTANKIVKTDGSFTDVQNAVNTAQDGWTVQLPSGNFIWTETISLNLSEGLRKSLHIRGATMDYSVVPGTDEMAPAPTVIQTSTSAFSIYSNEGAFWTLSNLRIKTNDSTTWSGSVNIKGTSKSWRLHHVQFENGPGNSSSIYVQGHTYGVIDHNEFVGTRAAGIKVDGDGWPMWKRPQQWGDEKAVYIEDNLFKTQPYNSSVAYGATDCNAAGRFVFRHNKHFNAVIQGHGFDSGGIPSCMSKEVYNNVGYVKTLSPDKSLAWTWLGQIRGGTSLWFNNSWELDPYSVQNVNGKNVDKGIWLGSGLALKIYRQEGNGYSWGVCDGRQYRLCSNVDNNWNLLYSSDWPLSCQSDADCTTARHGGNQTTLCKWKFCSLNKMILCDPAKGNADCSVDGNNWGNCSSYLDDMGPNGLECFQQPSRSTNNWLKPSYQWNNSCSGAQGSICPGGLGTGNVRFSNNQILKPEVDFFDFNKSFNGSQGVGQGLYSAIPTTCTPSTAYWASDRKKLYQCSPTKTWQEYYVPYTYPHPLASANFPINNTPKAPMNLRIQ